MKLRTTSLPLCDVIPLLQEAADELDNLTNEKAGYEKDEADMLMIAYTHGASSQTAKQKGELWKPSQPPVQTT